MLYHRSFATDSLYRCFTKANPQVCVCSGAHSDTHIKNDGNLCTHLSSYWCVGGRQQNMCFRYDINWWCILRRVQKLNICYCTWLYLSISLPLEPPPLPIQTVPLSLFKPSPTSKAASCMYFSTLSFQLPRGLSFLHEPSVHLDTPFSHSSFFILLMWPNHHRMFLFTHSTSPHHSICTCFQARSLVIVFIAFTVPSWTSTWPP